MRLRARIHVPRTVSRPRDVEIRSPSNSKLWPRAEHKGPNAASIIVAGIVVGIMIVIAAAILLRTLRARHANPKYIPTQFLKRKWTNWRIPTRKVHAYEQAGLDEESTGMRNRPTQSNNTPGTHAANGAAGTAAGGTGVDRNVSVRSVMTLPVYNPKAGENEQVLGREGERDGIDVVVEYPTAELEEEMREEEMNALYQIRAARRRQIAEREERRIRRREARDNGDLSTLNELRDQARGTAGRNTQEIENLRQEHDRLREARTHAVSSVSYADLGVARADGTRIRANSTESERVGLLSDAASMTQSAAESLFHRRERSASSAALSIDTARSHEHELGALTTAGSSISLVSAGRARSRADSAVTTPRFSAVSTRAGSSPEIIDAEDADLGDSTLMPPPDYDEVSLDDITPARSPLRNSVVSGRNSPYAEPPPDYPGPSQTRANRLSVHMDDSAAQTAQETGGGTQRPVSGTLGSVPRLPSLRLPQIVIDPSGSRS
ncbi:hypothetical protein QBC39DRAFT_369777 [Podospora conica]|nr:hypothetical protein QBC39DRAFT_369777 [Schizothecium conicum]